LKLLDGQETTELWRAGDIGEVELLHAKYVTYAFARHTHEGVAIGVIEDGAESFWYHGANHVAMPGNIIVFNPGEVHTGQGADERGWTFRIFYMDARLLQRAASETAGRPKDIPFFRHPIIRDSRMGKLLHSLHVTLESTASTLERESLFIWTFTQFVKKHADDRPFERSIGIDDIAVKRIREYLEDRYQQNVSLDELTRLVGMGPYALIRAFRAEVGLPPHAFLNQIRINRARHLLRRGDSLADTALSCGFVDQSHFTKHFKKLVGLTPGNYRGHLDSGAPKARLRESAGQSK
jgi:AraC-like DNA-binding protein